MNLRCRLFISIILNFIFVGYLSAQSSSEFRLKRVVIDAGHGGNVPGAVYGQYKEKDITLNVALQLGKMISENFSDVEVIYTRDKDIAVDLTKRSQIANNAKADLFISIHVNSARNTSASGVETFVMGYDQSARNMEVAQKENSVITYEEDYEAKYEGFDPNSAESYIIFSLMQYSFLEQSRVFAAAVQSEYLNSSLGVINRGVKQAAFLVLWRTTMPSVLTEIGFLSNTTDRKFLLNAEKQKEIAHSLFRAFSKYKKDIESGVSQNIIPVDSEVNEVVQKPSTTPVSTGNVSQSGNVQFAVQVASSSTQKQIISPNFGRYFRNVKCLNIKGLYKYYIISGESYKDALSLQDSLRNYRFKDAFIIAINRDEIIAVDEARRLLGDK